MQDALTNSFNQLALWTVLLFGIVIFLITTDLFLDIFD